MVSEVCHFCLFFIILCRSILYGNTIFFPISVLVVIEIRIFFVIHVRNGSVSQRNNKDSTCVSLGVWQSTAF